MIGSVLGFATHRLPILYEAPGSRPDGKELPGAGGDNAGFQLTPSASHFSSGPLASQKLIENSGAGSVSLVRIPILAIFGSGVFSSGELTTKRLVKKAKNFR